MTNSEQPHVDYYLWLSTADDAEFFRTLEKKFPDTPRLRENYQNKRRELQKLLNGDTTKYEKSVAHRREQWLVREQKWWMKGIRKTDELLNRKNVADNLLVDSLRSRFSEVLA